ncbi:MAG TPA: DNA-directed RNA polymerase subunit omega [Epsilonproteobacteria bacterium]|nr:DNA-directed RNA polymerase subunit omega [Campylobacterota bacterium]
MTTRTEQVVAKALEAIGGDRYLLTSAVGKRAEELSQGAEPSIAIDDKKMKYTDIALHEIAQGTITVTEEG